MSRLQAIPRDSGFAFVHEGKIVGEYVMRDTQIPRPYFTRLCTPEGLQVTRNHPPIPGKDALDHDKLHPGVWLAFGDINGVDFWRNKGKIEHLRFLEKPKREAERLSFSAEERYLSPEGRQVCQGTSHFALSTVTKRGSELPGMLLLWQTRLKALREPLIFGGQHEMGLGFRMVTPLAVKGGSGEILGSHGGENEPGNWGLAGSWWDYRGKLGEQTAGILAVVDSTNPRSCWAHARDYGFLAINPTGPPPDRKDIASLPFSVPPGESLVLRFALLFHATPLTQAWEPTKAAAAMTKVLRTWKP